MLMSIPDAQKKRGRPATGVTPQQGVRLSADILDALDRWRADQGEPVPGKADAMRRMIVERLQSDGYLPAASGEAN